MVQPPAAEASIVLVALQAGCPTVNAILGECAGNWALPWLQPSAPEPHTTACPQPQYVSTCFCNGSLFHKALKEAFEAFCNKNVAGSSSAELMASFCDNLLKKVRFSEVNGC